MIRQFNVKPKTSQYNEIYFVNLLKWLETVKLTDFHKCVPKNFTLPLFLLHSVSVVKWKILLPKGFNPLKFCVCECVYESVSFKKHIIFQKISNKFQTHDLGLT